MWTKPKTCRVRTQASRIPNHPRTKPHVWTSWTLIFFKSVNCEHLLTANISHCTVECFVWQVLLYLGIQMHRIFFSKFYCKCQVSSKLGAIFTRLTRKHSSRMHIARFCSSRGVGYLEGIPYPIDTLPLDTSTHDTQLRGDKRPEIPYPLWTDWRLWKHYLSAIIVADGDNVFSAEIRNTC